MVEVFDTPYLHFQAKESLGTTGQFFICGSAEALSRAQADPQLLAHVVDKTGLSLESDVELTTDDWPYFYQHYRGIPLSIAGLSLALLLLSRLSLWQVGIEVRSIRWHFFFLGAGFMLMAAQIISRAALLFGTTLMVNSFVISAILSFSVIATRIVLKSRWELTKFAYIGLFLSLGISYLIPLNWLAFESIWLGSLIYATLMCSPVFFVSFVFMESFAKVKEKGEALGSNIYGALVGGLVENISMLTGLSFLLCIAVAFYVMTYYTLQPKRAGGTG